MLKIQPAKAIYVSTQAGEALSTEQTVGHLVLSNGTQVQVKRVFGEMANNDTTPLLAAQATLLYRLVSVVITTGSVAPVVTFKSDTTAISPAYPFPANETVVLPPNLWGWMQTLEINKALNVTVSNSAAVQVSANFIELTDDLFNLL
jgi:hypothetical protein